MILSSATLNGIANPNRASATVSFLVGVPNGASAALATVVSIQIGPLATPVPEQYRITGLQPGTTYAYRIEIKNGYGEAVGATATFTTAGLPTVLSAPSPLAMLPIPPISFPKPATTPPKCKHGYVRNKHGKCVKVKKKPKKGKARKSSRVGRGVLVG